MKNSQFANILDECLERLLKGETVEQCLGSYPEQALELKPLLRTAQAAREASAITPRADFKARARYEFHSALHTEMSQKTRPRFSLRRGWLVAVMVISILLVSGGGTALAASNSMPDSPLYPVKLATEQVQLALTPSALGKAQLCATLAERRVAEIIYLADKGDAQQVEAVTQNLDERLTILAMLVSTGYTGGNWEAPQTEEAPQAEEAPLVLTEDAATAPLPTAPTPTPAPTPAPAPAPTSPQPTVEEPAPREVGDAEDVSAADDNRANLKVKVAGDAISHLDALQTALEQAPLSVKAALEHAIAVSENGYKKALDAMD